MTEVLINPSGPVLNVRLNRPEKKNALTHAMYDALAGALQAASGDTNVRVVLIDAVGDAFTAGNDLADFLQKPPSADTNQPVWRFITALSTCQAPVVAAVQGAAVGIGTTMLLHCDLVLASDRARFHMPFVDLGLVPEFGASVLVPMMAGYHRAAEYLLLGRAFDAAVARDIGLVNSVVPPEELTELVTHTVAALAAKPPTAVRLSKMLMRRAMADTLQNAFKEEGRVFAERLVSPEAKSAFRAFLEKTT